MSYIQTTQYCSDIEINEEEQSTDSMLHRV